MQFEVCMLQLVGQAGGQEPCYEHEHTENGHHMMWCHTVCSSGYSLASGCVVVMIACVNECVP
jgi:hypothetical protein